MQDTSGESRGLTWGQLARGAWAARAHFLRRGLVPGDRVLLLLPTGEAYVTALFGALWAGLVPTTLYPLVGAGSTVEREVSDLIAAFAPRAVVANQNLRDQALLTIAADQFCGNLEAVLPSSLDYGSLQALSYVQFTSGSTGRPRGLALQWPAIEANLRAIAHVTGMASGEERVVSWLPMYHDMGIFGSLLATLHAGCELTLMDPSVFTANPLVWLRVIHAQRATITVAPPSAIRACLDLLRRRSGVELNLSCLTQVICGAEPIPPELARVFAEALGPYGVPETALRPVYGLAEATLAVTFTPLGRRARIDRIERQPFETGGVARPARDANGGTIDWVSAGPALPGIEVSITDANGTPLPERQAGKVWVRSPSLHSAVLEQGVFHSRKADRLDTGDFGYMADGELYVTGRLKDLIIKNGRNYSPERLEQLAGLVAGVRRCAAFGIFDEAKSTERIVLMIEIPARGLKDAEMRDRLRLAVRRELAEAGYQVDEICLLPKSALPLTTSGKVRRRQCRETYLQQQTRTS